MFHADPKGILALVAVALCWALAVVLFRTGSRGSMARKLSLLLVFEGVTLGTSDATLLLLTSVEDTFNQYPWLEPWTWKVHAFGDCVMLFLYPLFLAPALQTRLTRPFTDKRFKSAYWLLP